MNCDCLFVKYEHLYGATTESATQQKSNTSLLNSRVVADTLRTTYRLHRTGGSVTTTPSADEMPNFEIASCKGQPTNWWFPSFPLNKQQLAETAKAVIVCRDCLLTDACLAYSLKWEPIGIWGGMTEVQRNKLRTIQNITSMRPMSQVRRSRKKNDVIL